MVRVRTTNQSVLGRIPDERHNICGRNFVSRLGHWFSVNYRLRNEEHGSSSKHCRTVTFFQFHILIDKIKNSWILDCGAASMISRWKRCSARLPTSGANPITPCRSAAVTIHFVSPRILLSTRSWCGVPVRQPLTRANGTMSGSIVALIFNQWKRNWAFVMHSIQSKLSIGF